MDALYNLIYCKPEMIMILGGACSEVTKTLGEIVPYWNLILFSYASISPALSKREVYKTFVSLAPADSSYNAARMLFIKHFNWDTVATIYEDTEMYSLAMADMAQTFEQNNISPKTAEAFDTDVTAKLENLKENDARIIIGGFSEDAARNVICEAYKLKLFGKRHVWMLSGSFTKEWWKAKNDTSCTDEQLTEALQGYFTVASINAITGSMRMKSIGGLSTDDFIEEYYRNNGTSPISPHAANTYDAMWTIALTLKSVVEKGRKYNSKDYRLEHFQYETGANMSQRFLKIIEELEFVGVSGPVSFDGPDRQGLAVIQQYQGGQMQVVALYEPDNESLNFSCDACVPVIWQGGRIPCDKNVIVMKLKTVDPTAFYTVCSLCILGVLLALFFLAFNLHNRSLKFIKLSSPILNNVAVIGCILVYLAVMLLGFDEKTMRQHHYPFVCTTRAFLFAAGFSLAFGSMFTKTYRVHQIFTRAHSGVIRSKLLRDKQLLFIIGALLFVDSSLVTVWVVVDPMHQEKTNLSSQLSETGEDIIYIYQLSRCQSTHLEKWMGVLYAYKGLMLVFGVYMAWETRNVKIPALNDSRYIGMNVYNVVIMSIIVVVLSNILTDQPTLSYAIQSTFIFLSTTGTLCLMFLPKIYAIMTSNGNPVITGSGITIQANIRRFDFSDKKELQYRAEIQNKVYKRELVALEEEIGRLEMLLEIPAITYFRLTDELLSLMPESEIDFNVITASMRGGVLQSCPSISDGDDMVSYFGDSTDDSRQQMDDHGDDEFGDGLSGKSPKKGGLKRRPNSGAYGEYELTFDEITDGIFLDKTDGEKKKKKGGWEKINISKLTSKGSKARAFFSGRRSASLRSVVTPPQTPSLPGTSTSSGESTAHLPAANAISAQVPMSLLSQRLQFQLKQAAQLSRQRLQRQAQSLPTPKPSFQRSYTQPSPPSSPSMSSKIKSSDATTPQGDQLKTVRFTVDSFEDGGRSEEIEGDAIVMSRRFEKEKHPGKVPRSLTLSASSSSLRIGSPSLLNVSACQSAMSISTPVSPNTTESTDVSLGIETAGASNLSAMKLSLHKILSPTILRELKLKNVRELQQGKEVAVEKPPTTPTPSPEVLSPPLPFSSTSNTDTTTTTTAANIPSGSSTMTTIASTTAPNNEEAVANTSSNTPSFTLASILQLKRQQSTSPTSSRSSAEIATTSEGTTVETTTPGDGEDITSCISPIPSIYVIGAAPKAFPEEIVDQQDSSASPGRQKPSTSSRSSFKSTSKTWARAAARAAAKAASRAAARASAAAAAAASSVKSSSSSSLSSALSSSTSTSSTGLHLHVRCPEQRSPNPQTPTLARVSSTGDEEGLAEEAAAQIPDPEQFDIPSAEGMEKVIDNERKIRIRRLQRDLTRIQKELQALDDLEYEVSYV